MSQANGTLCVNINGSDIVVKGIVEKPETAEVEVHFLDGEITTYDNCDVVVIDQSMEGGICHV